MDNVNSNIVSLVPGMVIRFGSLDFITGDDGKLGVASQETPSPGQIGSGPTHNFPVGQGGTFAAIPRDNAIRSGHGSLPLPGSATARSGKGNTVIAGLSPGSGDPSAECHLALGRDEKRRPKLQESPDPRVVHMVHRPPHGRDLSNEESLLQLLDSPTRSESSTGSNSPSPSYPREIFMTGIPTGTDPQLPPNDADLRQIREEAETELERNRALQARGRQARDDIMRADQPRTDIFNTPEQNLVAAKMLVDTLMPMLGEGHAANKTITQIGDMVAAAAVQQQERTATIRDRANQSGSQAVDSRPRGSRANANRGGRREDRDSGERSRDARNVIDERRREREEDERRRKGKQPQADLDHSHHGDRARDLSPQRSSPRHASPR